MRSAGPPPSKLASKCAARRYFCDDGAQRHVGLISPDGSKRGACRRDGTGGHRTILVPFDDARAKSRHVAGRSLDAGVKPQGVRHDNGRIGNENSCAHSSSARLRIEELREARNG